jgi:FkbM family methyltransferase
LYWNSAWSRPEFSLTIELPKGHGKISRNGNQMKSFIIKICKLIWGITPFPAVRRLYLDLFMKLVRGKKVTCAAEGMNFELDLSENIDVCILLEKFERDVVGAIEHYCNPGWHVLDIGANVGAHSIRLAKKAGQNGKVYAFEPTEYAYRKLVRNVSLNSPCRIELYRLALWNENKDDQIISFRSSWQTDGTDVSGISRVSFIRLDDWSKRHGIERIDMIKIDVDGHEFPIFDGGRQLLASCRPLIIMEVGAWHFAEPSTNVLALLDALGYHFWDTKTRRKYDGPQEIRKLLPQADKTMSFSINVVASPRLPIASMIS